MCSSLQVGVLHSLTGKDNQEVLRFSLSTPSCRCNLGVFQVHKVLWRIAQLAPEQFEGLLSLHCELVDTPYDPETKGEPAVVVALALGWFVLEKQFHSINSSHAMFSSCLRWVLNGFNFAILQVFCAELTVVPPVNPLPFARKFLPVFMDYSVAYGADVQMHTSLLVSRHDSFCWIYIGGPRYELQSYILSIPLW